MFFKLLNPGSKEITDNDNAHVHTDTHAQARHGVMDNKKLYSTIF